MTRYETYKAQASKGLIGSTWFNGYYSGYFDRCLGHRSVIALNSPDAMYRSGYNHGRQDWPIDHKGYFVL